MSLFSYHGKNYFLECNNCNFYFISEMIIRCPNCNGGDLKVTPINYIKKELEVIKI